VVSPPAEKESEERTAKGRRDGDGTCEDLEDGCLEAGDLVAWCRGVVLFGGHERHEVPHLLRRGRATSWERRIGWGMRGVGGGLGGGGGWGRGQEGGGHGQELAAVLGLRTHHSVLTVEALQWKPSGAVRLVDNAQSSGGSGLAVRCCAEDPNSKQRAV